MTTTRRLTLAAALASTALLAACGGGGGGSTPTNTASNGSTNTAANTGSNTGTSGSTTTVPPGSIIATGNQYASGSPEAAIFTQVNAWRQQCGFPAYEENTILDAAAQAHAQYLLTNQNYDFSKYQTTILDSEDPGQPGFSGVTGQDSADALGWPSAIYTGRGDTGYYTTLNISGSQYGNEMLASFAAGVYHQILVADPTQYVGLGTAQTPYNGYPNYFATFQIGDLGNVSSAAPLTFPCAGTNGVPYGSSLESPQAPGVSSSGWGTPITVVGNPADTIRLQSATITGPNGSVAVQVIDASTDPNHELSPFQGEVYPTSPLTANTQYSVSIQGTDNGAPFTRGFTFTTGSTFY